MTGKLIKSIHQFVVLCLFICVIWFCRGGTSKLNIKKNDETRGLAKVSRLIGCPFDARAHQIKGSESWSFSVKQPNHNHTGSSHAKTHPLHRRLTKPQFQQVESFYNAGLKPAVILETLKSTSTNQQILATRATIYRAKQVVDRKNLGDESPIVHLSKTLNSSDYATNLNVDEEGNLKALFFINQKSIQLLSQYNTVLFLDCTYKTNRYNMPLLHIGGTSGNNKTFSGAFCFMTEETTHYYGWALQCLKNILSRLHHRQGAGTGECN